MSRNKRTILITIFGTLFLQSCTDEEYANKSFDELKAIANQQTHQQVKDYKANRPFSVVPSLKVNCYSVDTKFLEKGKVVLNAVMGSARGDFWFTFDGDACMEIRNRDKYLSAIFIQPNKLVEIRCVYDQRSQIVKPPVILNGAPKCRILGDKVDIDGWKSENDFTLKSPDYVKEWPLQGKKSTATSSSNLTTPLPSSGTSKINNEDKQSKRAQSQNKIGMNQAQVSRGRSIFLALGGTFSTVLERRRTPKVQVDVPWEGWSRLSKIDQINLTLYAEHLVQVVKSDPSTYISTHFLSSGYESDLDRGSHLCQDCWEISLRHRESEYGSYRGIGTIVQGDTPWMKEESCCRGIKASEFRR
jgi:hypothetical protein